MIALDLQTFQQSRPNGNVTGEICLQLDDGEFPDKHWSDFPVIILGWWIDAFMQLSTGQSKQVEWLFMDGPYSVNLTKAERGPHALGSKKLTADLLATAKRVISHCEEHKMLSPDLNTLRLLTSRLKANQPVHLTWFRCAAPCR